MFGRDPVVRPDLSTAFFIHGMTIHEKEKEKVFSTMVIVELAARRSRN